ncbi:MAG: hypothetical protein ACKVP0_04050 [Pirellulaceae bacterium]
MSVANPNRILWVIMGGLLAWGLFLAVGTIVFPGKLAVYRALMIFGCTFAFVAFWGLMLLPRGSKAGDKESGADFPRPGA